MKSVAVQGKSGAGKTTLSRALITFLGRQGWRISYIKSIPHDDASFETEGKDTELAMNSGAMLSAGVTPSKAFFTLRGHHDLREVMILAEKWSDVCILEGFHSDIQTILPDVIINISPATADSSGTVRVACGSLHSSFTMEQDMDGILKFVLECLMDAMSKG